MSKNRLSHVDAKGRIRMVDVGDKDVTDREAVGVAVGQALDRGVEGAGERPARREQGGEADFACSRSA